MSTPIWLRRLVVFAFMLGVSGVLYFSLPVDSRAAFILTIRDIAGPLIVFLGVMFVFIRLVQWADGGE